MGCPGGGSSPSVEEASCGKASSAEALDLLQAVTLFLCFALGHSSSSSHLFVGLFSPGPFCSGMACFDGSQPAALSSPERELGSVLEEANACLLLHACIFFEGKVIDMPPS